MKNRLDEKVYETTGAHLGTGHYLCDGEGGGGGLGENHGVGQAYFF